MLASAFRYLVCVAAFSAAAGLMFASLAAAQTSTSSVDQFLANPSQVLAQYPNGGARLTSMIRDLATSRPGALQSIVNLLTGGNTDQQSAIGTGLGLAYKIVINTDQSYATRIAEAIAGSSSAEAKTAYAAVVGDTLIGAAGGIGGGGGGGGAGGGSGGATGAGGIPIGGTNTFAGQGSPTSFQTSTQAFTGGGGSITGASSSTLSVSPR